MLALILAIHFLEGGIDLRYTQELLGYQSSKNIHSPLDKIMLGKT